MEFRTPISLKPSPIRISHQMPILTLGSCFANIIGGKLTDSKLPTQVNPYGVLFNPLSLFKVLSASIENKNLFSDSFIQHNDIWYNYDLHSDLSDRSREHLTSLITEKINETHLSLKKVKVITFTFGTAFIYRLISSKEIVANCHKIPSSNFVKELLSPEDILKAFEKLYESIRSKYSNVEIILTVSPVRHLKDGMESNALSKSILRMACHQIQCKFPEVDYFPSYEIMMDDLRDYRFYGKDMIHPSEVAENYIWDKFMERYMDEKTQLLIKEWGSVQRALHHKPFHAESEAYKKFLLETLNKLKKLSTSIPLSEEIRMVEEKLNSY